MIGGQSLIENGVTDCDTDDDLDITYDEDKNEYDYLDSDDSEGEEEKASSQCKQLRAVINNNSRWKLEC